MGEKEKESACVGVCLSNKLGLGVGEVGSELGRVFYRLLPPEELRLEKVENDISLIRAF